MRNTPKPFAKSELKERGVNFVPFPSDARHYIYHPRITAEKLFLYTLIIDYYNEAEGFAFPSLITLEMTYGKHRDTISRHLDDLKAVGLIDYPDEKGAYIPLEPLSQADFFTAFPEANEAYLKALAKRDSQRDRGRNRMRKWRERKGYA